MLIANGFQFLLSGAVLDFDLSGRGADRPHRGDQFGRRPGARPAEPAAQTMSALLEIRGLVDAFRLARRTSVKAVDGVSFDVARRRRSSGWWASPARAKAVTGFSILGLIDPPGRIVRRAPIKLAKAEELVGHAARRSCGKFARAARGDGVPGSDRAALNPVLSIAHADAPRRSKRMNASRRTAADARVRHRGCWARVGIPDAAKRGWPPIRINCRAACASAWRSPSPCCNRPCVDRVRRADDRTRRVDPSADPVGNARSRARFRHGVDLDQPRPRHRILALASRLLVMYAGRLVEDGSDRLKCCAIAAPPLQRAGCSTPCRRDRSSLAAI